MESALDTGFAYGLINDTEPAINQAQAGLTKNMRDENYYRSSQTSAQPKTNKDGGTPKDCAEKIHNPAVDKAPFMNQEQGRSDKTAQAAGALKRAVKLPHRSGGA